MESASQPLSREEIDWAESTMQRLERQVRYLDEQKTSLQSAKMPFLSRSKAEAYRSALIAEIERAQLELQSAVSEIGCVVCSNDLAICSTGSL